MPQAPLKLSGLIGIQPFNTMVQRLLLCISLCYITLPVSGQYTNELNSLERRLKTIEDDSARFFVIDSMALLYSRFNFDSAEYYNARNLAFAGEMGSDYYLGRAMFRKSANHVFSNRLPEAIVLMNEALIPIEIAGDKWLEAQAHYYLGNMSYTTSEHANAIYHYQHSLVLSDSLGWPKGRVDNRHNLGGVFFDLEDYERADQYFQEAKRLVDELGDYKRIPMMLAVMTEVALVNQQYNRVDSLAKLIVSMADTLITAEYQAIPSLIILGKTRLRLGDYEGGLPYFFEALEMLGDETLFYPGPRDMKTAEAYYFIGEANYHLGRIKPAREYLLQADTIARGLQHYTIMRDAAETLWRIEEEAGNHRRALAYHQAYKSSSDSILNNETLNRILRVRVDHAMEQRRKEEEQRMALIELEAQQRTRTYFGIIALVALGLIIVVLLLLLQRSRTKREKLIREKVQTDLDSKHRELTTYVLQLMRKNELLMEVSDRLKKLRKSTKQDQQKELLGILNSIALNSKEIGWDEFELRFKEVHPSFYESLARQHPSLTSNESRLCAFLKLNMTSKEISAFTFQSEHSIVQARSRLKKKLGLEEGLKLSQFIASL